MDINCELILEEYNKYYSLYEKINEVVLDILDKIIGDNKLIINSIESRIKTYKSLYGKLELKGYKYNSLFDITDIFGARIVTYYMDEVDKFAAKIEKTFEIDWDNTIDKRKMFNIDQFGYMSLHYICKIPKELYFNPEFPEINNIKFEIQIRSVLQHIFARIQHDTGYKSDVEIPKEYLRKLTRLAGLLETADVTLYEIRNEIENYRRRVKKIVKNKNYTDVELNVDTFNAFIENGGFDELNQRIATIGNMEIEKVSLNNFLKVFKTLGLTTLKDLDDFIKNYSDLAYEFSIRQFADKDLDIISSVTGPLHLCIVYLLSKNVGESIIKVLLDTIYGERKANFRLAKRLNNIGVSMGLIKAGDDLDD